MDQDSFNQLATKDGSITEKPLQLKSARRGFRGGGGALVRREGISLCILLNSGIEELVWRAYVYIFNFSAFGLWLRDIFPSLTGSKCCSYYFCTLFSYLPIFLNNITNSFPNFHFVHNLNLDRSYSYESLRLKNIYLITLTSLNNEGMEKILHNSTSP